MVRRSTVLLVLLFMCSLATGSVLRAHEGHPHKIMGTVTMASADHLMLKDRQGKDITVKIAKDTKVKAKPAVKVEDIKQGTRVVVAAMQAKDKSFTAKTIEVGAPPAAAK